MNLKNKADLEQYFAENFDTVFFPLLADLYKNEKDLNRARKVCEIGLEYHPNNIPGEFILAEINQLQGNLTQAEKFYKNILANCPWHYRALINLVKIEAELNRSVETITKLWTRIIKINPTHAEARLFLELPPVNEPLSSKSTLKKSEKENEAKVSNDLDKGKKEIKEEPNKDMSSKAEIIEQKQVVKEDILKDNEEVGSIPENAIGKENEEEAENKAIELDKKVESPKDEVKSTDDEVEELKKKLVDPEIEIAENDIFKEMSLKTDDIKIPKPPAIKQQKKLNDEELQSLDITPRMATFTMVNVLKKQKLYQQALYVLKMLEEKGADQALIDQEKHTIQELLDQNESE